MNSFVALSPLLYVGVALAGIPMTALVLFFLLRDQKSIQAKDGTRFAFEEACLAYEAVCDKLNALYLDDEKRAGNAIILGLRPDFLKLLKEKGFSELKTLMEYREDFKKLGALLEGVDSKEI